MLVTLPSPIPKLQHAPLPSKVLQARERAPTFDSSTIFALDSILNLSRNLGVRQYKSQIFSSLGQLGIVVGCHGREGIGASSI